MPRVAIQVVLHRSEELLPRLLRGLDHLDVDDLDVIVRFLDNAPGHGARALIESHHARLRLEYHESPRGNIGFGAGHNLLAGLDRTSDYLLFLNPDTIPFHDVLTRLVAAARRHPSAALVEAAQFPVEHQKAFDTVDGATNWCCATCLLARREPFMTLGGFDERLFLYCEDVDLSWRMWAAGHRCIYVPTAKCVHVSQEEDHGKDRTAELHHMHLGDLYLRRKWFGEDAVEDHRHHLEVWVGADTTATLFSELDRLGPPPAVPERPPEAMLMPDHINYGPIRW